MIRIWDLACKDWRQLVRDRKTFMFTLVMPIVFTVLFGYAFGGFGGDNADARLPIGYLDQDASKSSQRLSTMLANSEVVRLAVLPTQVADLEQLVAAEKLAGAIVVPPGYGKAMLAGKPARLILIADTGATPGRTVEAEIVSLASRLDSAVRTATIMEQVLGTRAPFDYAFERALKEWQNPPIAVTETTSDAAFSERAPNSDNPLGHTSPGMMLQFSIAGLMTAVQIMVAERKSRALQRILTTATKRLHILLGHYVAIYIMNLTQFVLLIAFGALILRVEYWRAGGAVLLVAASAALCIAALGLLIGVLAKSDEQATTFALVPMFVLAGLGGAWVPLEVTGETFQTIGHLSPVAWAMDGFKNITLRGLGWESVWLPCAALVVYALAFFTLAAWRFWTAQEH